jgi:hypothetical protein
MDASPRTVCPACHKPTVEHMDMMSAMAALDYFICRTCFRVWTVPKLTDGPVEFVTNPATSRKK